MKKQSQEMLQVAADYDEALEAIKNADIPLKWWAEVIAQVRTFQVVDDDRLLRVQAIKPMQDEVSMDEPIESEIDCPVQYYIEDLDYLEDAIERDAVTLWERPDADRVAERHYHGTDLLRAEVILAAAPAAAELKNPWDPCTQP